MELSYQIIAHSRTCYGLITMRNYDLNCYLIKIFDHTFGNFVIFLLKASNQLLFLDVLEMPHVFSSITLAFHDYGAKS